MRGDEDTDDYFFDILLMIGFFIFIEEGLIDNEDVFSVFASIEHEWLSEGLDELVRFDWMMFGDEIYEVGKFLLVSVVGYFGIVEEVIDIRQVTTDGESES